MNQLFYKVIHNKYLFNKIINYLDTSGDDSYYENTSEISYKNESKKFKDINSFYWMTENKQLALLKCKLEAGELLDHNIDLNEIEELYGINTSNNWLDFQSSDNEYEKKQKRELFKLLLDSNCWYSCDKVHRDVSLGIYKPLYQLDPSLIEIAVGNKDPKFYGSIQVFPSTLESAFLESSPEQIKVLLDSFYSEINCNNMETRNLINKFKNNIIIHTLSISNIFQRDRVLEVLFSDSKYYYFPSYTSSSLELDVQLIDLVDLLFNFFSVNVQNKLLDLKLYKLSKELESHFDKIETIINNSSSNNRIIELIEFVRNNCNNNYIYDIEIIKNPNLLLFYLKYFLENNKFDWKGLFGNEFVHLDFNSNRVDRGLGQEFIKYYSSLELQEEHKWFKIKSLDDIVRKDLKRLSANSFLIVMEPDNRFTKEWKLITSHKDIEVNYPIFILKNNEAVDFMAEYYDVLNESCHIVYRFLNFDVYDYSKRKIKSSSVLLDRNYDQVKLLSNLLQVSIVSNNLDSIKKIENYIGKVSFSTLYNSFEKGYHGSFTNETFQVLDYFCSNDLPMEYIYYCLKYNLPSSSKITAPTSFKSVQLWANIFIKAIKSCSLKIIEYLLNSGINPIMKNSNIFNSLWRNYSRINDKPIYTFEFYKYNPYQTEIRLGTTEENKKKSFKIVSIIKLLIQDFKREYSNEGDNSPMKSFIVKLLQDIVDSLFQTLIQIKNVPIENIIQVCEILNSSNSFGVLKSTLVSVYLLSIKSLRFTKYIQGLPFFFLGFRDLDQFSYRLPLYDSEMTVDPHIRVYDLRNYLNLDLFNFQFIFENSFDTLLNQLINQLSYNAINIFMRMDEEELTMELLNYHSIELKELVSQILNYNLEFCLDINREDLFMDHLKFIKNNYSSFLNDSEFNYSTKLIKQCLYYGGQVLERLLLEDQKTLINYPSYEHDLNIKNYQKIKHLNFFKPVLRYSSFKYHEFIFNDQYYLNYLNDLYKKRGLITDQMYCLVSKLPFSFYKSMLQLYSNNESFQFLKPSQALIDYLITFERISFLKYIYLENLLDNQLKSYLISKLKSHHDLVYVNWLN